MVGPGESFLNEGPQMIGKCYSRSINYKFSTKVRNFFSLLFMQYLGSYTLMLLLNETLKLKIVQK